MTNNKIIGLLMIFLSLSSCGQNTKVEKQKNSNNNETFQMKNPKINYSNVVEKTLEKVKHYDKEPMYFIRAVQSNCVFEILINDFPLYKEYSLEKLASPLEINNLILKSGIQTVTVRMYPLGDLIKKNYGEGKTVNTLLKKTKMQISVVKYEDFKSGSSLNDEILIKKHTSPNRKGSNEFIGAGLSYYEYSFNFQADVPYSNTGWSVGEDLTKFDKDSLEQRVFNYYQHFKNIYKNKNIDELARLNYNHVLRSSISQYKRKEEIEGVWEEYNDVVTNTIKEMKPIEGYKMQFYGNNRVVCLKFPSKEPVEKIHRGKSAFWFAYKRKEDDKTIRGRWIGLYLFIPKGESLDSLQPIH